MCTLILWLQEYVRLVSGSENSSLILGVISLGLLSVMSLSICLIYLSSAWVLRYTWSDFVPIGLVRKVIYFILTLFGIIIIVVATQEAVEWSSSRFRQVRYRGLFSGLIAAVTMVSLGIVLPFMGRVLVKILDRRSDRQVTPSRWLIVGRLLLGGGVLAVCLWAPDLIVWSAPQLSSVDIRPPLVAVWSVGSLLAYLLLAPARLMGWVRRIERPISIIVFIIAITGVALGMTLQADDAWRLQRDTALSSVILSGLQKLDDRDRDGSSGRWGGGDCHDQHPKVKPSAIEIGRQDLNCDGVILKSSRSKQGWRPSPEEGPPVLRKRDQKTPKNLILLTIDALRYDDHLKHMPALRAFAQHSIDFRAAYSAGAATYWSIPALLGSKPPSYIKMGRDQTPVNEERLLTESLRDQGFHTGLFANVTIFFVRGLSQGALTRNYDTSKYTVHGAKPGAAHLTSGLIRHIETWRKGRLRPKRERLFLWGHYYDPHEPYFSVPKFPARDSSPKARYESILRSVDQELGRLFKRLEGWGMLRDTMVVITADHGEEFRDHGHRFHGKTLYEEMTHVPLIIYSPEYQAQSIDEVISHLDVAPTLLDHLGLKGEASFLGESWDQSLRRKRPLRGRPAFFEVLPDSNYHLHMLGVRQGDEKMIYHVNTGALEYFDLDQDPKERLDQKRQNERSSPLYHLLQHYTHDHLKRWKH